MQKFASYGTYVTLQYYKQAIGRIHYTGTVHVLYVGLFFEGHSADIRSLGAANPVISYFLL